MAYSNNATSQYNIYLKEIFPYVRTYLYKNVHYGIANIKDTGRRQREREKSLIE